MTNINPLTSTLALSLLLGVCWGGLQALAWLQLPHLVVLVVLVVGQVALLLTRLLLGQQFIESEVGQVDDGGDRHQAQTAQQDQAPRAQGAPEFSSLACSDRVGVARGGEGGEPVRVDRGPGRVVGRDPHPVVRPGLQVVDGEDLRLVRT